MALVRYGPLVARLSGVIGGSVFATTGGRGQVKRRGYVGQKVTEASSDARAAMAYVARLWKGLPDEFKAGWNAAAENWWMPDRVEVGRIPTGRELFTRHHCVWWHARIGLYLVPPEHHLFSPPVDLELVFDWQEYAIRLGAPMWGEDTYVAIYGGRHFTSGGRRRPRLRYVTTVTWAGVQMFDVKPQWDAVLGELHPGERFTLGWRSQVAGAPWGWMLTYDGHRL